MTLRRVAAALERLQTATLTQLAAELGASPREVEPLMAFWERRGNVRRCSTSNASIDSPTNACGSSCRGCPLAANQAVTCRSAPAGRAAVAPAVLEWVA